MTCGFLRLDERVHVHRVSIAKKAVARRRMSTSSRSLRFSRRSAASSSRSLLVRPSRSPAVPLHPEAVAFAGSYGFDIDVLAAYRPQGKGR
ncbi:hypothetical protein, partial [Streptomyces chartreusis]